MGKQATRPGVEDLEPCCFRNHYAMVISTKGRVPSLSYAIDHVSDDPDASGSKSAFGGGGGRGNSGSWVQNSKIIIHKVL
jgi:hypothetical protein